MCMKRQFGMNKKWMLGASAALLLASQSAMSGLIGVSTVTDSLYDLDPVTGLATLIAGINPGIASGTGATFLDGTLYATDIFGAGANLFGSIDEGTGAYTGINNQDGSGNWHALASDESSGIMYTVDFTGQVLKSVTAAGVVTTIGTGVGFSARGMAYDDGNGILYAAESDGGLYTIDVVAGTSSFVGNLGVSGFLMGLAYDEDNDTLYFVGTGTGPSSLYTVSVNTGVAALVGAVGVNGMDGLAWISDNPGGPPPPVDAPEPWTALLLAAGIAGVSVRRGKR